ncbi:MAG: hypothetical protein ACN6QH_10345, partial [Pseudomonas sp.]|uniref:hypothetical protein n=1 Tax=Pseudomonas sp. TaxID=306 RepID=UPI003D0DA7FF
KNNHSVTPGLIAGNAGSHKGNASLRFTQRCIAPQADSARHAGALTLHPHSDPPAEVPTCLLAIAL